MKLAEVRGEDGYIHDRTFRDDEITGPVVVAIAGYIKFSGCTFPNPLDMLIEVPEGKTLIGVVGIHNCSFIGCRFKDVGIVVTPHDREMFLDACRSDGWDG